MNKTIFYFLIFMLIFATTTACASKSSPVNNENNLDLEISYRNGSSISPTGDLEVVIRNTTSTWIKFPMGFDIKVFVVQDKKIKEIPNSVTYIGNDQLRLVQKAKYLDCVDIL